MSNQKRREIKKLIIYLLDDLKTYNSIELHFDIVYKDDAEKKSNKEVKKLTPSLINQSKDIFLNEIIDCNQNYASNPCCNLYLK